MDKKAIIYLRWSTLEQGNSDRSSEYRQDERCTAAAASKGWSIVRRLVDSGKSAYTGANLTKGELGKLTKELLARVIDPSEHILCVEELDRLSRQSPGVMSAWMSPLLDAGLCIYIANTGQLVTKQIMETDFGGFVTLMAASFSGHDFSRKQSARGAASWAKRRESAAKGVMLSRHRGRGWLRWDEASKIYQPIPERVWLVHEMFRLRLAKKGKAEIAKLFNTLAATDERYRAWSTSRTPPKRWTATAIARIVQDRGVTGFVQYNLNPRGADKKIALGEPIKVYPVVIDEDTWSRANDARLDNQVKTRGRGRAVSNLLGPLARCKTCGGTMQPLGSSRIRVNKDGTTSQHYPIYCQTAKMTRGQGCSNQRGWPYRLVERPILDRLLSLAIDDQHFSNDDDSLRLEGEVIRLQRRLTDQTAAAKRILDLIQDEDDDLARQRYDDIRKVMRALKLELATAQAALAEARGRVSPGEHIVRVAEVRSQMDSADDEERYQARMLVKSAVAGIVENLIFDPSNGLVTVRLKAGLGAMHIRPDGSASYLDLHRTGRHGSDKDVAAFERRRADIIEGEGSRNLSFG